jgi:hypothetical protein
VLVAGRDDGRSKLMKVKYTVAPSWTIHTHSDVIEIDDEDLDGLTDDQREAFIGSMVEEVVAEVVPWGWEAVDV